MHKCVGKSAQSLVLRPRAGLTASSSYHIERVGAERGKERQKDRLNGKGPNKLFDLPESRTSSRSSMPKSGAGYKPLSISLFQVTVPDKPCVCSPALPKCLGLAAHKDPLSLHVI